MVLPVLDTLLGTLVYCALMLIYLPFFVFGTLKLRKTILILKIKRFFGYRTESKLGLVSRRNRITDVSQVSTDEEIDFLENRMMAYIRRMTLWTPRQIAKTAIRRQTIDLISDEQLAYVILSSVFAHSVVWDGEKDMFRLKMEGFEDLFLFQGFYWDARNVLVSTDASKIIIEVDGGDELHSDDVERRADYNLAKLHVQICLSYFAPGLSHNHVHFVFPSSVCLMSKKVLNPNGTLYKLLSPHFRFTERINYQALRVGKATNNKRSKLDRFFFFWQAFPVTKEQFMEGVARKCKKHYVDYGGCECKSEEQEKRSNGVLSNGIGSHSSFEDEEGFVRCHNLFPPDYVTNPKLKEIPYLAFLRSYYMVVQKFVKDIVPHVDKSEWDDLAREVGKHVPLFEKVDIVTAITTFIHQVGVVHFCDHNSYLSYFAYRYGCMSIRTPFERFENTEHWQEVEAETGISVATIKKNPLVLIRQRDVMRTRCFLDLFVDFIPNPACNVQLIDTEYGFEQPELNKAAQNFLNRLRELDENLTKTDLPIDIPVKDERDLRAVKMQVTPLKKIVRTVCF